MAAPVWVLSVDLQAKTAVFQSGMAEAAKSARSAFTDIKSGASEMGGAVGSSAGSARQAVMLLGDEFGIHLPRGLTTFIASLGPIGPAMEAAFPFVAIILGATLLLEHLAKLKAAGHELTENQVRFGTAAQNAFNALDERLLRAQIRTDELRNDHVGALRHQLELLNKQSLDALAQEFDKLAQHADKAFADIKKAGWIPFIDGAAGAKHALEKFQTKYADLLAHGKGDEASNLLSGTLKTAQAVLDAQQHIAANTGHDSRRGSSKTYDPATLEAYQTLKRANVGITDAEVAGQRALVDLLLDQGHAEGQIASNKKAEGGNLTLENQKAAAALQAEGARSAAEHAQKMGEIALNAERESSNAALAVRSASIAERLAADERLANEEYTIQSDGNKQLIDALNKGGNDYNNQLRALQQKGEELTAQHEATLSDLSAKAKEAQYREDLQNLETSEREKINATDQGSAVRLAALDSAIKEEQSRKLQDTEHYRELLQQRVEVTRQSAEAEAKVQAALGKEAADNEQKMGELTIAMERQQAALRESAGRTSAQQRLAQDIQFADAEYAIKLTALQQEAAALDKGGNDYLAKLKEIQDKEAQLTQQHENTVTDLKNKAVEERNAKIKAAEDQLENSIANNLTQTLMGHKSFAASMNAIGNEVVSSLMQMAIKHIETNLMTKQSDASAAAASAFRSGEAIPYVGVVLGPIFAASAYAGVMAFQDGGIVPGIGTGDIVPAMLEPGEGVVKRSAMDRLNSGEALGGGTTHTHMHYSPTFHVQTIDRSGVRDMLNKHNEEFANHYRGELRRMNK